MPSHCGHYPDIECVRFLAPPKMFPPAGPVWLRNPPGLKWPKREAGRSPASSAEAKNKWSYTSASCYAFMAWTDPAVRLFGCQTQDDLIAACAPARSSTFRDSHNMPPQVFQIRLNVIGLRTSVSGFVKCCAVT